MRTIFLTCFVGLLLFLSSPTTFAQARIVSGTIADAETSEPLIGASIVVKNTTKGVITDIEGHYSIEVSEGNILRYSFIGYISKEIQVGSSNVIDVAMEPDVKNLGEVVVTAMGITKETKSLGYAVQGVNSEELNKVKEPNLVNSLNGKIAGVNVTNSGGGPGASSQIIIRGSTSLTGNNQPLFIVDGIPVDNSTVGNDSGSGGLSATSTYTGNRGMDLNSDDIESISVLKGPAAAALYGLKAADGAIVITTKKGKSGLPEVSFSSKMRIDKISSYPDKQKLYGQGNDGAYDNGTFDSWGEKISGNTPIYDNVKDFFETAVSYDVNGSVSGGNENGNYFMSVRRLDQKGIVPTTDYTTNSFRFNGEQKKGWFTFGMNTNYIYSQTTKTLTGDGLYGSDGTGAMNSLFNWPVSSDMRNWLEDGKRVRLLPNVELKDDVDNPYWTIHKNPITDDLHRFIGSGYVAMTPTTWLTVTYRTGIDHYNQFTRSIIYPGSAAAEPYDDGSVSEIQYQNNIYTSNLNISADKKFNDFDLHAMVGHNYEQTTYSRNKDQAKGLLSDFISINNADDENKTYSNYRSTRRIYSVYGELSVGYRNFAFLSFTGRKDWSSTLAKENRSFFYPSVSGSFLVSQFFPIGLKDVFSFAKLRASWSQVGKDAPVYQTATYLSDPVSTIGGGYKNSYTGGNPDLKPETTESTELGLDLRFWQGRFGIDFTYYDTRSKDQIISPRVSMATGYIFQYVNFGTVTNKGIEVTLNSSLVKKDDWRWDTSLNISHNDGTVSDLPDGVDLLYVDDVQIGPAKSASVNNGDFLALTGQLWERDGDGNLILDSDTGAPITSTTATNIVGNREPDLLMGLNNSITYKNWNVSFLLNLRLGGDVYNATEYSMTHAGTSRITENRGEEKKFTGVSVDSNGDYYHIERVIEQDQEYYQNVYTAEAPNFIQSVNWVRLQSASLTYSLPKVVCQRIGFIKTMDLSLTGTNLWLLTNYDGLDPETNAGGAGINGAGTQGIDYFGVPSTTSVSLGVNVKF
jgi:TonB-linked SusC/RagA family outer membrane protein